MIPNADCQEMQTFRDKRCHIVLRRHEMEFVCRRASAYARQGAYFQFAASVETYRRTERRNRSIYPFSRFQPHFKFGRSYVPQQFIELIPKSFQWLLVTPQHRYLFLASITSPVCRHKTCREVRFRIAASKIGAHYLGALSKKTPSAAASLFATDMDRHDRGDQRIPFLRNHEFKTTSDPTRSLLP